MRGTHFFVTSQDDPDTTFQHGDDGTGNKKPLENIGQIIRRIHRLVEFTAFEDRERGRIDTIRTDRTEEYKRRFNVLDDKAEREDVREEELITLLEL